jgi:hypothetical protein
MKSEVFPDKKFADKCWTHNLAQLRDLAGLKTDFDVPLAADPNLQSNWNSVKDWSEESRYAHATKTDAENLYEAIADKKHGVLIWLKLRW